MIDDRNSQPTSAVGRQEKFDTVAKIVDTLIEESETLQPEAFTERSHTLVVRDLPESLGDKASQDWVVSLAVEH